MSVSMKDVAKLADVSVSTVSHVINKTRKVNSETAEKVHQAIKDLDYNVNPIARNLRSGRSKMIGVVVSNLSNSFFLDIALSIDKILKNEGYQLIYINSNEDKDLERENIESLVMQNVDGIVIAPVGEDCSYMESLVRDKCPIIFFDRLPRGFESDCIMSTNYDGAYQGTELLIKNGHKRIGFIGSHSDVTMNERIEGYKSALEQNGIGIDEDIITTGTQGSQMLKDLKSGDGNTLARFLVEEKKVSAIFCGNNLVAIGVIIYLMDNNYKFPEEIGLVTFDDAFWLSMTSPGITAVEQDREKIGETAARVLLDRINKTDKPVKEYRIPTKLILRGSC